MRKLLLAAAASVATLSPALAGDLAAPVPHAVDYVKVCDAYGEGFFYIPGTETCLKVGGYVRAEYRVYNADDDFNNVYGSAIGWGDRRYLGSQSRVRTQLTFDARTNTEYGLLRSYIEWWYQVDTGSSSATPTLWSGFIQFGGLTAGRTQSFFDFYLGSTYVSVFESAHSDSRVNLLAYTFGFGNGVTATISAEDPTTGNASRRFGEYGGLRYPDLVGNIKIDQAWGSAQIMGALHQDIPADPAFDKDLGWAIGGGLTINLPMIAPGDNISVQAAYSKGAITYVTPDPVAAADFFNNDQAEAWAVAAGFLHVFSPKVSFAFTASYLDVDHPQGLNLDYTQWDVSALVEYAPVSGLTIGFEVEYKAADFNDPTIGEVDALVGLVRIQRNF